MADYQSVYTGAQIDSAIANATAIGTIITGTSNTKTLTTRSYVYDIGSITLTTGVWVITGRAEFNNKSDNTYRTTSFNSVARTSGSENTTGIVDVYGVQMPAISGGVTELLNVMVIAVTDASKTFYLNARSGVASTVVSRVDLQAVKISNVVQS